MAWDTLSEAAGYVVPADGPGGGLAGETAGEADYPGGVRLCFQEAEESSRRDGGGHRVVEGVEVHGFTLQHLGVQSHLHHAAHIVHHGEGRYRAGLYAEEAAKPPRAAEGEALGTELVGEPAQIDLALRKTRHQPVPLLLVAKEEVLRVRALDPATEPRGLLHREDRGVVHGCVGDSELVETP